MPGLLDFVFVTILLAWGAWDHFVLIPASRRAIAAGHPGARMRFYGAIAASEWLLALAALALWWHSGRAWAALGFSVPAGVRLAVALVLVALLAARMVVQARAIARMPREKLAAYAAKLPAGIALISPHTAAERGAFRGLSLTAGFCEELLARGYLMWFIGAWTGPWIAAVLSSALFGLGHAYQGRSGVLKTGVVGLVMALVYLGTGSLLPGIALHALIDLGSGDAVGHIFAAADATPAPAPAEA